MKDYAVMVGFLPLMSVVVMVVLVMGVQNPNRIQGDLVNIKLMLLDDDATFVDNGELVNRNDDDDDRDDDEDDVDDDDIEQIPIEVSQH